MNKKNVHNDSTSTKKVEVENMDRKVIEFPDPNENSKLCESYFQGIGIFGAGIIYDCFTKKEIPTLKKCGDIIFGKRKFNYQEKKFDTE